LKFYVPELNGNTLLISIKEDRKKTNWILTYNITRKNIIIEFDRTVYVFLYDMI